MVEFGEKLKKAREGKGMTQQTLADHLYVTRQAVSRWECGARKMKQFLSKRLPLILMGLSATVNSQNLVNPTLL